MKSMTLEQLVDKMIEDAKKMTPEEHQQAEELFRKEFGVPKKLQDKA
jgi:hypothetical protein